MHPAFDRLLVHNLKAPLTTMLASLEMLQDGDFGALTAAQRSALDTMQQQGRELLAMIEELLEVGSVDAMARSTHPVDVGDLLRASAGDAAVRLGGRVTVDVGPDVPPVMAHAGVLRRVLSTLLHNAERHGGPSVEVRLSARTLHGDAVEVMVEDTGPGIPAHESERVFEPFVRLDPATAGGGHGGLGLTYCRAAVTAMGGTIAVAVTGRGAALRMELPAAVAGASMRGTGA